MKSNKELVLDYIHKYCAAQTGQEVDGISTQYLSDKLDMQRTNLSAILNQLVKEGKIEKTNGRPVLYRMKQSKTSTEFSCFKNLIGFNGSLKTAVQLAKASVLYPQHSLHSIIIGPSGSGKSFFAKLMYTFAVENNIIAFDAPFVRFNCRHFIDNSLQMVDELFGIDKAEGALFKANNGFLVIDHADVLAANGKKILVDLLEDNYSNLPEKYQNIDLNVTIICCINADVSASNYEFINNKVSVKINLPGLVNFQFNERLELIQHFFTREATKVGRHISINSELLRCLLLYDCLQNIKQLSTDIRIGCANAYVREFQNKDKAMTLFISDFPSYVRQGFLGYKKYREEIEKLIPENFEYTFSEFSIEASQVIDSLMSYTTPHNIYERIDKKNEELKMRGIPQEDINFIVSVDIDTMFKDYVRQMGEQVVNTDQLAKVVDEKIITLVNNFVNEASRLFGRVYPISVFYGLCLHLNATLERVNKSQRLSNNQIMEIVEKNKSEYAFSMKFANEFERVFNVSLPIDEVVFITMFICQQNHSDTSSSQCAVLFAMHGDNTATSIAKVVNSLVKANNCYGYDMSLDSEPKANYQQLKDMIVQINQGKGILMLYDMGSFKTMADMIMQETNIPIKLIEMPVTLFGIDCARKASMGESINEIYDQLIENYKMFVDGVNEQITANSHKVIISLCMSGEGGAIQIKNYIENNMNLTKKNIDVIPLAISDRDELLNRVNAISKESEIICIVGSFNPYLFNIPYISIAELFNVPKEKIEDLLFKTEIPDVVDIDYDSIYDYLRTKFDDMDVDVLRPLLQEFIMNVRNSAKGNWSEDQECGLLVHVACCIYRIMKNGESPQNVYKDALISNYQDLYQVLKKFVKPLEKAFNVELDDNELSIIISIIKKV